MRDVSEFKYLNIYTYKSKISFLGDSEEYNVRHHRDVKINIIIYINNYTIFMIGLYNDFLKRSLITYVTDDIFLP